HGRASTSMPGTSPGMTEQGDDANRAEHAVALPQSSYPEIDMTSLPLNGFTVLDLTAHRAGPTAVRQLADWGADVIKIEAPGEATDATGSRRDGPDFQNLHRNKRSITINLKSPEGHALFMKMAAKA